MLLPTLGVIICFNIACSDGWEIVFCDHNMHSGDVENFLVCLLAISVSFIDVLL